MTTSISTESRTATTLEALAEPSLPALPPRPGASARPLTAVLAAIEGGSSSVAELSGATGLQRDVVEAAVAHLVRLGRLSTEELSLGCPPAGCGGCVAAASDATSCGTKRTSTTGRGPVLVSLRRR